MRQDEVKPTRQEGSATGTSTLPRSCIGITRYGRPCPNAPTSGKDVCWHHAPENAERRKQNATAGGKAAHSPAVLEIRELKDELKHLIQELKEGQVVPNVAGVITQLANTMLRAIDQEHRVHQAEDLEERLARLEAEGREDS